MHSCIYRGQVSHRRFGPTTNRFSYDMYMMYMDLAEAAPALDRHWLWSARGPAPAWLRRRDHLGDPTTPLDQSVRDLVASETGERPDGPVRLLTHFRYFGYCFNPLSAYYCFDRHEQIKAVVLEVSNMPWRQMHPYVLANGRDIANGGLRFEFAKQLHVSPFLPMQMDYRCSLKAPGEQLLLSLENWRDGKRSFDAQLNFRRIPITSRSLARCLVTDPLATLRVTALIHWQALKLWRRRVPVYDHPGKPPGKGDIDDRAAA